MYFLEGGHYKHDTKLGELCSTSWGRGEYIYINYLQLFWIRYLSFPSFIYVFKHLFISVWTHEYLFFTWGYNPIFFFKLFLDLAIEILSVGFCVPLKYPISVCVCVCVCVCVLLCLSTSFLAQRNTPGSSCIVPAPVLKLVIHLLNHSIPIYMYSSAELYPIPTWERTKWMVVVKTSLSLLVWEVRNKQGEDTRMIHAVID